MKTFLKLFVLTSIISLSACDFSTGRKPQKESDNYTARLNVKNINIVFGQYSDFTTLGGVSLKQEAYKMLDNQFDAVGTDAILTIKIDEASFVEEDEDNEHKKIKGVVVISCILSKADLKTTLNVKAEVSRTMDIKSYSDSKDVAINEIVAELIPLTKSKLVEQIKEFSPQLIRYNYS